VSNVERRDYRKQEPVADRAECEVPRWIEPRREDRRDDMAESRDERPRRGLSQGRALVNFYVFFFPCSSYS
jgi:hypothetical protein